MSKLRRIAFVGNSLPRRCGIATFTSDLQQAVAASRTSVETSIVAMSDFEQDYDYPESVGFEIQDNEPEDYIRAAKSLNAGKFDVVSLQHEFGIFGGAAGAHVLTLMSRVTMPIVTTLHTVLANPTRIERDVMDGVIKASTKVVVMATKAHELLRTVYNVPADKIDVIAHGIPDVAFVEPDDAKAMLGYAGKSVILTFGLLSPNKGIEVMIDAMPGILQSCPNAVYLVLGATHPNLVRTDGEAYRRKLINRAEALGVSKQVIFIDQFVDRDTLLGYIAMCDVYATPSGRSANDLRHTCLQLWYGQGGGVYTLLACKGIIG